MITYKYKCNACTHEFDIKKRITDNTPAICPICATATSERIPQPSNFALKGNGWAKDGYR